MAQSPRQPTMQSRIAILIVVLLVCLAASYWAYFAEVLPTRRSVARSARVRSSLQKQKLRAALIASDEEEHTQRKHKAHHTYSPGTGLGSEPSNTWTGLSGYWDSVDVIEAADLSRREFERKYMVSHHLALTLTHSSSHPFTRVQSTSMLDLCWLTD